MVERGGLENRSPAGRLLGAVDAAQRGLALFAGAFGSGRRLAKDRLTTAGAARDEAPCSAVQRTRLIIVTDGTPGVARLIVTQAESSRSSRELGEERPYPPGTALPSVAEDMMRDGELQEAGFDAGERELPEPLVPIADETKERLALALTAIVGGATPEELADYLDEGAFPDEIVGALDRAGEREEMFAHIDLLLRIQQSPSAV